MRQVVSSIPIPKNKIFNLFNSLFWCQDKGAALSYATQHAMPPELILDSLFLTCCMRDTG